MQYIVYNTTYLNQSPNQKAMTSITAYPPSNILIHSFRKVEQFQTSIYPEQFLHVSKIMDVFTELIRLNIAAKVTVKLQYLDASPKIMRVTPQGIYDVPHPPRLEKGAKFEISGFSQCDTFLHPIFILTQESTKQFLLDTPKKSDFNDFCVAYEIEPKTIQHVQIQMCDRCASFVTGSDPQESIEEWSQKECIQRIFHINAQERVQQIKKDFNPPSPKMFCGSIVDQLNRLVILHRECYLTKEEFSKAKAMLLL